MASKGESSTADYPLTPATCDQSDNPARLARAIWQAGVAAVDSTRLVANAVSQRGSILQVCDDEFDLKRLKRLIVVGAGKASAGMARGLEQSLDSDFLASRVEGWINVPADCIVPTQRIHLHPARPAGLNEPTEEGVFGSRRIMELVAGMEDQDLCIVLLSGGGSALLPLPVDGITLADKQAVTRFLSRNGATIHELNTVRKRLSLIKGGGLVYAAKAGRMIALIISDVVGDPLDVIASGPTVCDSGTSIDALAVLERFQNSGKPSLSHAPQPLVLSPSSIPVAVWNELRRQQLDSCNAVKLAIQCRNQIIGNNQTALDAAICQAELLGFEVHSLGSNRQGEARDVGRELAEQCLAIRQSTPSRPICCIGGGEPVVHLAPTERPRVGGRNQELALAALCRLWNEDLHGMAVLSGGTDGEDGPTDAAGAICSETVRTTARQSNIDPFGALSINDSYTFFAATGGLLKTGPTHTNVMDLQVAVLCPEEISVGSTSMTR